MIDVCGDCKKRDACGGKALKKNSITSKKSEILPTFRKNFCVIGNWKCLENSEVFVRNLKKKAIFERKLFLN